jgi:hypothetical protein
MSCCIDCDWASVLNETNWGIISMSVFGLSGSWLVICATSSFRKAS